MPWDTRSWLERADETWLGRQVEFSLLGQRVQGKVIEALLGICAGRWLIVEFRYGPLQIKVGGPYRAFRRIKREE